MEQKKEINYLKAFSIILVVFYHVIFYSGIFWFNLPYICLCITLENVHVPLFILLAGYLCHKQDIGTFYLKKVRRILIPFLFMSALKLLFSNLLYAGAGHGGTLPEQFFDAFVCSGLYWFCYCILILFLLAPLFWNRKILTWIVLALTLAANIYIRQNEIQLTNILQLSQVLRMFPYFLIGMLLSGYQAAGILRGRRSAWILLGVSLGAGAVCGYFRFHEDVSHSYYIDLILGLAVMYILYFLACRIRGRAVDKILTPLGRYSYQIMLLDGFYRIAVYKLLQQILPVGMVLILLSTGIILALSCLSCVVAEKIPGISFLLGLKELRRRA